MALAGGERHVARGLIRRSVSPLGCGLARPGVEPGEASGAVVVEGDGEDRCARLVQRDRPLHRRRVVEVDGLGPRMDLVLRLCQGRNVVGTELGAHGALLLLVEVTIERRTSPSTPPTWDGAERTLASL